MWRVAEALVQSTAITCAASMSLVVTFVNSASLGYPTCLNIFPALIVRSFLSSCSTPISTSISFPFHFLVFFVRCSHLRPHLHLLELTSPLPPRPSCSR